MRGVFLYSKLQNKVTCLRSLSVELVLLLFNKYNMHSTFIYTLIALVNLHYT